MNRYALLLAALLPLGVSQAQTAEDDFPTLARVEYVLGCMRERGGENYDNLYGCTCAVDYLRSQFTYEQYSEASVYTMLRSSPGEKGGVFRSPPQSRELRGKLSTANEAIERRCFLKNRPSTAASSSD